MATTKSRASKKVRYEPVLELPALSYEEFTALRDNIGINGVLIPILVDSDGPVRRIIDGNQRKAIANELGYPCPEIVQADLTEDEKRTMARALNLARRQLSQEQRRKLVADQLGETPERSNRWVGRQLGVHHATVASVRADLEGSGQIIHCSDHVGSDGRVQPASRPVQSVIRTPSERQARIAAATLIHGDCRNELKRIATGSVDAVITDPIYPCVKREYGQVSEAEWMGLMQDVVRGCRRILKPKGSAVFILQANSERIGKMRLWLWEFVAWAGREWNLVQDAYWWAIDIMPLGGIKREQGLMRPSVKWCVWLGEPNCYRDQGKVLWTPSQANSAHHRSDIALRTGPSGRTYRNSNISKAADERGGTTPHNLVPISIGGQPPGREDHPAATPYTLARWWTRYILPPGGVLLDPFCGSGTMLQAGLDEGASKVIGIDKEKKYLGIAQRRMQSS